MPAPIGAEKPQPPATRYTDRKKLPTYVQELHASTRIGYKYLMRDNPAFRGCILIKGKHFNFYGNEMSA